MQTKDKRELKDSKCPSSVNLTENPHHKPEVVRASINNPPEHTIPIFTCHILPTPTHSIILRLKAQQLAAI